MTKPWDETMKKLIDTSPQELLDWLAKGVKFLHFVPTELLKPNEEEEPLRADRYLAVEQDGQQGIVHLEIQSGPDANMDERLLGYNYRFTQNDPLHRTVYSIVIYLRSVSQPPQSPLVRIFLGRHQVIRFDYGSIELAQLDAQEFLDLGLPGLLPHRRQVRGVECTWNQAASGAGRPQGSPLQDTRAPRPCLVGATLAVALRAPPA